MDWKLFLAIGGWILAFAQFFFTHIQSIKKDESELLEKTLSYFERGTQARSIAISLVDGIWFENKKKLHIILPILISQAIYLLTEAEDYAQESRNLIRLLKLIHKCLPYANKGSYETPEILEALLAGAQTDKGINLAIPTLRLWYAKFNDGDSSGFEIEIESFK